MSAHAETASFGGKTIKIIVGMPPGGGVDSYARLAQRHLGRFLPGSPGIVVQNMPGAGSLRSVMALVNSLEDVVGTVASYGSDIDAGAREDRFPKLRLHR